MPPPPSVGCDPGGRISRISISSSTRYLISSLEKTDWSSCSASDTYCFFRRLCDTGNAIPLGLVTLQMHQCKLYLWKPGTRVASQKCHTVDQNTSSINPRLYRPSFQYRIKLRLTCLCCKARVSDQRQCLSRPLQAGSKAHTARQIQSHVCVP